MKGRFNASLRSLLVLGAAVIVSAAAHAQRTDGRWLQAGLDAGDPHVTGWVSGYLAAQRDLERQIDAELARLRSALNEVNMSRIDNDRQFAEARLDTLRRWQDRTRLPPGASIERATLSLRRHLATHPDVLQTDAAELLRGALQAPP